MKRSEINRALSWAESLLAENRIRLPPFGYWSLAEWKAKGAAARTIRATMLGWDITDFGGGRFDEFGAVLFTLRNGSAGDPGLGTPYAEKLILLKAGQRLPLHRHACKTEDIINRGGGVMRIELYNALGDGGVDRVTPVTVDLDGVRRTVPAGEALGILPGESITLRPYMYHKFWADAAEGDLACGEVSSINDDRTDNYNAEPVSRFATVEEDEEPARPLCNEYDRLLGPP